MLKSSVFLVIFCFSFASLFANCTDIIQHARQSVNFPKDVKTAQERGDYKTAATQLRELIRNKPHADYYLLLAVNHLLDQQEEEAFKSYLECLERAEWQSGKQPSATEQEIFNSLFQIYLEKPQELEVSVKSALQEHPDFHLVQYFYASTCANQHKFEPFFYLFYQSYKAYPESHFAHKTKGVVSSLLYQRARNLDAREQFRKKAITHFTKALEIMPKDTSVHRMLLSTSTEVDRQEVVRAVIEAVVGQNIVIVRHEIPFYVNHALMAKMPDLADRLIDKAKSWYEYSRILQEMQNQVNMYKQESQKK